MSRGDLALLAALTGVHTTFAYVWLLRRDWVWGLAALVAGVLTGALVLANVGVAS